MHASGLYLLAMHTPGLHLPYTCPFTPDLQEVASDISDFHLPYNCPFAPDVQEVAEGPIYT